MRIFLTLGFICLLFTVSSCEVKPVPINFGTDTCHFCKMTIVDQQHAAQYVTKKGKQFKFDAVECLLNDLSENGMNHLALLLVSNYSNPGEMTDAKEATYLISVEIKSPMGANLSSFGDQAEAESKFNVHGGKLYSWEEMLRKYQVAK